MGGLVRHYYFSKYLQKKGHEVKIFTSSQIHNTDVNMIKDKRLCMEKNMDGITYTFVRTSDYKGNSIGRIINMLQFPKRIWSVCRRFEKPDVIYTSSPDLFTAVSAVIMAKWLRVKKVVEIRDLWPESIVEFSKISKKNLLIRILYGMENWLYRNADELIFTMAGGKQYIWEKGWTKGIDPKKIHYINNGVDLKEFKYNKEHFIIKDKDLENPEVFKVVYTGSIRKVYNLSMVVACAKELQIQEPHIKILIWGDGTEKSFLENECRKLCLTNIVFKGRVEKKYIPFILSKADINLMHWKQTNLSKYGCSLNKLFEYMAAGQMIVSDVRNSFDLLEQYKCGIITKSQTPKALKEEILRYFFMEQIEKEEYSKNMKNCVKKFDYKILTDKLEKVLESAEK